MSRTIAVTGATGLIGRRLVGALLDRGDRVVALVRHPPRSGLPGAVEQREWSTEAPAADLHGVDAVVHLAGAPVAAGRWTAARKRAIEESRVHGTHSVVAGIRSASGAVKVLVSASGIDIYGDTGDEPIDEKSPLGTGFLSDVCVKWEGVALAAEGCRVVLLRTGLVLAMEGGALPRLLQPIRFCVGGPLGSGRQYVPWIHMEDEVGLILHALDRDTVAGPLVAAAPKPLRNQEFVAALGKAVHRPTLLRVPVPALRLVVGEMAGVLLASHNTVPRVALETGYAFRHPELEGALADLLG